MPSCDFNRKIGGRDFDLYIGASTKRVEYSLEIKLASEIVTLWGEFAENDLHVTWNKWAATALRHIRDGQKQSALPRLQMYELYLLSLWIRELEA